jgi:hypothetical protein
MLSTITNAIRQKHSHIRLWIQKFSISSKKDMRTGSRSIKGTIDSLKWVPFERDPGQFRITLAPKSMNLGRKNVLKNDNRQQIWIHEELIFGRQIFSLHFSLNSRQRQSFSDMNSATYPQKRDQTTNSMRFNPETWAGIISVMVFMGDMRELAKCKIDG